MKKDAFVSMSFLMREMSHRLCNSDIPLASRKRGLSFIKHIVLSLLLTCAFFSPSISCTAKGAQVSGSGSVSIDGDPEPPGMKPIGDFGQMKLTHKLVRSLALTK